MAIDVVVIVVELVPSDVPRPLLLYPREQVYKEVNRVGCNMILINILSLLTYFTYIFINIIIFVLRNTI
jgi:hypothetical protein